MTEATLLERLCIDLRAFKTQEDMAKKKRLAVEEEIAGLVATKDEGTDKVDTGNYKISVTSKLTRKLDYEAYLAIEADLPDGIRCVDLQPKLNIKKLRAMDMVNPTYSAQFVTSKPAKAAVKVEAVN